MTTDWFTKRALAGCFFLVAVGLGLAWWFSWRLSGASLLSSASQPAFFILCDVGQGDAVLLQLGSFQMLVDAGQTPAVLDCLDKFMPANDRFLEVVVASHADSDHIEGFQAVFTDYMVGEIWLVKLGKKTAEFEAFSASVSRKKEQGTAVRYLNQGGVFELAHHINVQVLSPRVEAVREKSGNPLGAETTLSDNLETNHEIEEWGNDRSIVLKVVIFNVSILLTGDIEKPSEQALVQAGLIEQINILKVAHHGSKTSSTKDFLDKAQPEIAAVSSGKNNKYGHPSPEVIANLLAKRAKILRTDQLSHVVLEISRGSEVKIGKKR